MITQNKIFRMCLYINRINLLLLSIKCELSKLHGQIINNKVYLTIITSILKHFYNDVSKLLLHKKKKV